MNDFYETLKCKRASDWSLTNDDLFLSKNCSWSFPWASRKKAEHKGFGKLALTIEQLFLLLSYKKCSKLLIVLHCNLIYVEQFLLQVCGYKSAQKFSNIQNPNHNPPEEFPKQAIKIKDNILCCIHMTDPREVVSTRLLCTKSRDIIAKTEKKFFLSHFIYAQIRTKSHTVVEHAVKTSSNPDVLWKGYRTSKFRQLLTTIKYRQTNHEHYCWFVRTHCIFFALHFPTSKKNQDGK